MNASNTAAVILEKVKKNKPLIHHITNYVTAGDCANVVLAFGGYAVMADDPMEVEEVVAQSSALVINIGTINCKRVESFILAGKKANSLGIPVVLDPVGIGATKFRSEAVYGLLAEIKISVLRGNMSEIKHIYGIKDLSRGIDSTSNSKEGGREISMAVANQLKCVVAITGETDYISNGENTYSIENGHPMLTRVTGTGCMTTSLIAACCGTGQDPLWSAITGITLMGVAGEIAYESLSAETQVGTFREMLFNTIGGFNMELFKGRARINEV